MKKVFTNWKMSLSALLLVSGLMFVSTSAQAQGAISSTAIGANADVKGAGTWVLEAEALTLLEGQLQGPINQALTTLPSGGQQYIVWKAKAELYETVYANIKQGISPSKSVALSYAQLAGPVDHLITPLSAAEWQTLLNELVDLLTT